MDWRGEQDIYKRALKIWSIPSQFQMYFEESAELTHALCKYTRSQATKDDVCKEIADVLIMCYQLAEIFGNEKVVNAFDVRMHRLLRMIETREERLKKLREDEKTDK